jgi:pseudouridine kinase
MPRVIVIGGANVDVKGRSTAVPIAGTSNPGTVVISAGGVGRNIAHNLALLGVDVALIAAIGDDAHGGLLRRDTMAAGVDLTLTLTAPVATGTYVALLDERGELITAINDMRCTELVTPEMLEARAAALRGADLLVADCNLALESLGWIAGFAAREGKRLAVEPVSVPKVRKLLSLPPPLGIFVMTPNAAQVEALGGLAAIHALGVANVVEHRGADGAVVSDGRTTAAIPAHHVMVRDVTGAGDAAVAGLLCGLAEGRSLIAAARMGQAAAAIKLQSAESVATTLNRDSLRRLLES